MFSLIELDAALNSPALRAQIVNRTVTSDSHQPWSDSASLGIEALCAIPDAKKCFLNQVLRSTGIRDNPQNQAVNHLPVPVIQFRQGLRVTLLKTNQEVAIGLRQDCQQKCEHAKRRNTAAPWIIANQLPD